MVSLPSSPTSDISLPTIPDDDRDFRISTWFDRMGQLRRETVTPDESSDDGLDDIEDNGDKVISAKCCREQCNQHFETEFLQRRLVELCANLQAMVKKDKDTWLFDFVRGCRAPGGGIKYKLFGQSVCKGFILQALAIGPKKLNKIKEYLNNGLIDYPHLSSRRLGVQSTQLYKADAWFQDFYVNFAEPYAKGSEDAVDAGNIMEEATVCGNHPLWAVGVGARESDRRKVPVKFVDTVTLEHIFDMHMTTALENRVSRATLRRAWDNSWKNVIKILPVRTHSRCARCAELDEYKKKAITEAERLQYEEEKANHIKDIKADRATSARGNPMSEEAIPWARRTSRSSRRRPMPRST